MPSSSSHIHSRTDPEGLLRWLGMIGIRYGHAATQYEVGRERGMGVRRVVRIAAVCPREDVAEAPGGDLLFCGFLIGRGHCRPTLSGVV